MATSKKPMVKSKTNIATRVVRTAKKALVDPLSMVPKSKPKRPSAKTPIRSVKPTIKAKVKEPMPKSTKKTTPKRPVMPAKINPFKMTPAQKAEFLRNPKAYE